MERLSRAECGQLAALHCACLPDSLVSELGTAYAAAFYRYVNRSPQEMAFVARTGGDIIGGCVLTLSPATLRRRLLMYTPLLFHAVPWLCHRVLRRASPPPSTAGCQLEREEVVPVHLPELILVFTRAESRSRGTGASLVALCEEFLAQLGHKQYLVRTEDHESNRALKFYERNGFVAFSRSADHGRIFRVFRKNISPT
jgi:GNAT superfamily N-acetyltransferase